MDRPLLVLALLALLALAMAAGQQGGPWSTPTARVTELDVDVDAGVPLDQDAQVPAPERSASAIDYAAPRG